MLSVMQLEAARERARMDGLQTFKRVFPFCLAPDVIVWLVVLLRAHEWYEREEIRYRDKCIALRVVLSNLSELTQVYLN